MHSDSDQEKKNKFFERLISTLDKLDNYLDYKSGDQKPLTKTELNFSALAKKANRTLEEDSYYWKHLYRKMVFPYDIETSDVHRLYKEWYSNRFGIDAVENKRFINIGPGSFRHLCWTNIDKPTPHYTRQGLVCDIEWDALDQEQFPLENDSICLVYCSHMIDHIDNDSALAMFREIHRVLKPGGLFRLIFHDVDILYQAYLNKDCELFWKANDDNNYIINPNPIQDTRSIEMWLIEAISTAALNDIQLDAPVQFSDEDVRRVIAEQPFEQAMDYLTGVNPPETQRKYSHIHSNWFTKPKVLPMMEQAGFSKVWESAYGQSREAVLRDTQFFDRSLPIISAYLEAQKL